MRGGIIYIVKINIKADNKHVKLNDKDKQSISNILMWIIYMDEE